MIPFSQPQEGGERFNVALDPNHHLAILSPGEAELFITKKPITYRPVNDPSLALRKLELEEARMVNASLPIWRENYTLPTNIISNDVDGRIGMMEVSLAFYFNGKMADELYMLVDNHVVQTWSVRSIDVTHKVDEVFVGPHENINQPISINYLIIGKQ